jgi:hypothetical protein
MTSEAATVPPLDLPPGFSLVTLQDDRDPFLHACGIGVAAGAGIFVLATGFERLEFAVILEPGEALASARRGFFAGMTALANAIALHCPPEKPIAFAWPHAIRIDGAVMGWGRLGWPEVCAENAVPEWMVFAAVVNAAGTGASDPGFTSLEAEGFETGSARSIAESFARHLKLTFDLWEEQGFERIAQSYIERLDLKAEGELLTIADNGDLLILGHEKGSATKRLPLAPALRALAWLKR